jgi:prohibitin 1
MAQQWDNQNPEFNVKKIIPILIGVVSLILVITFWNKITVNLKAGQAGVMFKQFSGGVDKETIYGEGFHFIAPWNEMVAYDVTQQEIAEVLNVLSSNGLEIKVDVSIWFRPDIPNLGYLHSEIRENYVKKVVIPAIRSAARMVVGRYAPEEIYSSKREAITQEIDEETKLICKDKYVTVERILIRSIELPPTIKTAIETKLKQEQETLEYEFRLAKASKEAERQILEAEGKAKANEIISKSLTDKILQEKGIEATLKLATSPNAKVVVIGGGDEGLPIILGNN